MIGPDGSARRRRRIDAVLFVGILALAAWLRLRHAAERELWLDDMTRVRLSLLSWDALWTRLPFLDPYKSPYLIGLHKLWTECVGTDSLFAMRAFGGVLGVGLVAAAYAPARAVVGGSAALATCFVYAVHPFFVRWSIELHDYAPAAIALAACWGLALSMGPASWTRFVGAGALAGFAVGVFPPVAAALAPMILLPGARRFVASRRFVVCAATACVVAAPALLAIARSARLHRTAFESGAAWSPYFNPKTTPFEVMARMSGLDVRQGGFTMPLAAGVVAVLLAAAAALALSRRRRDDPADWRRRVALFLAGVLPPIALCAASVGGVGLFNDRYVHGAAALLPLGLVAAVDLRRPRVAGATAAGLVAAAACAATLATGIRSMAAAGAEFPRDSATYLYRCDGLLARELAGEPAPALVLVHGEAQTSQILLRSKGRGLPALDVRHLTTSAWRRAERDDATPRLSIPHAYGWPYGVRELAGGAASVDRDEARALVADRKDCWIVLERERVVRMRMLEDDESPDLDAAYELLAKPADAERDAAVAAEVLRYLRFDRVARVRTASDGPALLVKVDFR